MYIRIHNPLDQDKDKDTAFVTMDHLNELNELIDDTFMGGALARKVFGAGNLAHCVIIIDVVVNDWVSPEGEYNTFLLALDVEKAQTLLKLLSNISFNSTSDQRPMQPRRIRNLTTLSNDHFLECSYPENTSPELAAYEYIMDEMNRYLYGPDSP